MNLKYLVIGFFAFIVSASAFAADSLKDDLTYNLYAMKSVYRAEYAPAAWKNKTFGYDLNVQFDKAITALQVPDLTLKQGQMILKDFVFSMKDYHTSISFVSTEQASLPFSIKGTADHFFFVYIDRDKLPESSFPFHVGDEVLTFGGKPTAEAVAEVQAEYIENVPGTDKASAESSLTLRRASRGRFVPTGPITLEIKAKESEKITPFELIWNYTAEKINPRGELRGGNDESAVRSVSTIFHPIMNVDFDAASPNAATPFDLGARKTFTPDLGTKVWESGSDNEFYAYIYKTVDRKLIGYVRIAGYESADYVKALSDFSKIIEKFEATTDSMIIDQVYNPGGSVFYLYGLASMLTDKPLVTPLHRMAITQSDVASAVTSIATLSKITNDEDAKKEMPASEWDGYPVSYELAQFSLNYARFIVSEWNAGRKLTSPYWIGGVNHINAAATHYTKPILLLINHLDYSGGDFFPTIMQDNKRVTILGSRTAGAGGYVNDVAIPNNVGVVSFRCTESIAERVNKNPIENLGVTPDIPYEMTVADFTSNFAPYVKLVQDTAAGMSKP
jgi:hypothetical protein